MKCVLPFITLLFLIPRMGLSQEFDWVQSGGSEYSNGTENERFVHHDDHGNTYSTGYHSNYCYFTDTVLKTKYKQESHVVKYGSDNKVVWLRTIVGLTRSASNSAQILNSFVSDSHLVVAGQFHGSIILSSIGFADTLKSKGGLDAFVALYSTNGDLKWARAYGASQDDRISDVVVDTAVYVTGRFRLTTDFNRGNNPTMKRTSKGLDDLAVVKYDLKTGATDWIQTFGSTDNELGIGISRFDSSLTVLGRYSKTVAWSSTLSSTSNGRYDAFLIDLQLNNGNVLRKHDLGGSGNDLLNSIAKDSTGIYLAGYYSKTVNFNLGTVPVQKSAVGAYDVFLCKYNHQLDSLMWIVTFGGNANDIAVELKQQDSLVYIAGYFSGSSCNFNPNGVAITESFNGKVDAYAASYNKTDGNLNQIIAFGGSGNDLIHSLSVKDSTFSVSGYISVGTDLNPNGISNLIDVKGTYQGFISSYNKSNLNTKSLDFGSNSGGYDYAEKVAIDSAGNSYVLVEFEGEAIAGTQKVVSEKGTDLMIVKYDNRGTYLWHRQFSSANYVGAGALYLKGNHVFVGAEYRDSITIKDKSAKLGSKKTTARAILLSKFDLGGTLIDYETIHTSTNGVYIQEITSSKNHLIIGGTFNRNVELNPRGTSTKLIKNKQKSYYDGFLACYNLSTWELEWNQHLLSHYFSGASSLAADDSFVFAAGYFRDSTEFNLSGGNSIKLKPLNENDGYLAQYNLIDGECNWVVPFKSKKSASVYSMIQSDTTLFLLTTFSDSLFTNINGIDSTISSIKNTNNYLIGKYNKSNGQNTWINQIRCKSGGDPKLLTDGFDLYCASYFGDWVNYNSIYDTVRIENNDDVFMAKYSSESGKLLWGKTLGISEYIYPYDFAYRNNSILMVGEFDTKTLLDSGASNSILKHYGDYDFFIGSFYEGPNLELYEKNKVQNGDAFDFGTLQSNNDSMKSFNIVNSGNGLLNLTNPIISGNNDFNISQIPSSIHARTGDTLSFTITYKPLTAGLRVASTTINSNDRANPAFVLQLTGNSTLDIKPLYSEERITVYPNPTSSLVYLSRNPSDPIETYVLINASGTVIGNGDNNPKMVDLSDLSFGVYLLKTKTKNGNISYNRIIKN